jgi:hypothetical protein
VNNDGEVRIIELQRLPFENISGKGLMEKDALFSLSKMKAC